MLHNVRYNDIICNLITEPDSFRYRYALSLPPVCGKVPLHLSTLHYAGEKEGHGIQYISDQSVTLECWL